MPLAPPLAEQSRSRRASLKKRLDHLYATFDRTFLETDPLAFVHRYESDADREIVGFLASTLAFGNVRAIQASVGAVLDVLGPSPSARVDQFDPATDGAALAGLYHRWVRGVDIAALLLVIRRMREETGSMGAFFMRGYDPDAEDIGGALASFSERARALARSEGIGGGLQETARIAARAGTSTSRPEVSSRSRALQTERQGKKPRPEEERVVDVGPRRAPSVARFFASPRDGSACKRLNLYLRWMVRDGDGLDLGVWRGVSRRQLVLPLDTHLVRLSRALGLSRRRTPGWRMAVETTRSLALFDPDDPVKYDFSLSRLGILDRCLHGRDALDCRKCPVRIRIRRARRAPRS